MGIRRRILVSFFVLFIGVLAVTGAVATILVSGAVERRLEAQVVQMARLIDGLSPTVLANNLDYLRRLAGAEELTVGAFSKESARKGVFRAPTAHHGELLVKYSPQVISQEEREAVRPFVIIAVAGLALVLVLATVTARTVARPLEQLAEQARSLPKGDVRPVGGGAELDHLVEAMNRMLADVRRAERLGAMGQMAAGVAHEIRNPLSSMKMTVQMLREPAGEKEPYDLLLREIERLELTAAELAGASQPLRLEPASVEAIVDEVLELMRRRLDHLGIRVERRYSAAPSVRVDGARFKRCVMNLVLNGVQAMPSGGPLEIAVAPRDGRVRFSVKDAGPGVPAGIRDRVFEPFVTSKQDGVGLGLALTRRIVEDHGGEIGFETGSNGTIFWIELPNG